MSDDLPPNEELTPVTKLTKDLRVASRTLTDTEARFLVDAYYMLQNDRIRADGQVRSMSESEEPISLLEWLGDQHRLLEAQVKVSLDVYSYNHPVGSWARSVIGVGPVIAAGLLAHIDITKAPTAGHIFSFAGLNPMAVWEKGQKRPWNAKLKTLCWKLGESFVKTKSHPDSFYGPLYEQRKAEEWKSNLNGEFSDQARETLRKKRIAAHGGSTYRFYNGQYSPTTIRSMLDEKVSIPEKMPPTDAGDEIPMLPPAHIHARAKRWTVKIFLSNLHEVWYEIHYGEPAPAPYPLAHLGHVHKIFPVNSTE